MNCFSIGYQGKSLTELCTLLAEHTVEVLLDVRERAWSQRPEFRKQRLKNMLAEYGIEYEHFRAAGNPYRPQNGHLYDFEQCAKRFTEYLDRNPEITQSLQSVVSKKRTALFCYEKYRSQCHRNVLFEALADIIPDLKIIDL